MTTRKQTKSDKVVKANLVGPLNDALKKGNLSKFLKLLNELAATHGMTELSRMSGLDRSNLYEIFSARAAPRLSTLYVLLDSLGLQISVQDKKKSKG